MAFGVRSLLRAAGRGEPSGMVTLIVVVGVLLLLVNAAGYALNAYHRDKHEEREREKWLEGPKKWHD